MTCWHSAVWLIRVEGNRSGALPTRPAGNGSWHVVSPKTHQEREGSNKVLGGTDKNYSTKTAAINKQEQAAAQSLGPFCFQYRGRFWS